MVEEGSVITVAKKNLSSISVIRRSSDTRLLNNSDLNLALMVEKRLSENKIVGYVTRYTSFESQLIFLSSRNENLTVLISSLSTGPAMGIPDEGEFEDQSDEIPFQYSHGITQVEAERLLIVHGRNELPEKTIPKW